MLDAHLKGCRAYKSGTRIKLRKQSDADIGAQSRRKNAIGVDEMLPL